MKVLLLRFLHHLISGDGVFFSWLGLVVWFGVCWVVGCGFFFFGWGGVIDQFHSFLQYSVGFK